MHARTAEVANTTLNNLARKLVDSGVMSEAEALAAQTDAIDKGRTFSSHLVREKLVEASGFAHIAAEDFGLPLIDL